MVYFPGSTDRPGTQPPRREEGSRMLVVDCCIRGEDSATRRYYQAYLKTVPQTETELVELEKLGLEPLNRETLARRDQLCARRAFDHGMFRLARQFRDADEILIAAPFWDLSFPSLLKVYLEHVSVSGLTFGYTQDGRCVGHCKAGKLLYFSTCGGFAGENLGFAYVKALAAMLGIERSEAYVLEGLDLDPARREAVLEAGIAALNTRESSTGAG